VLDLSAISTKLLRAELALRDEIIRDLHETPRLGKRPAHELVITATDGGVGQQLHGCTSEQERRSFDSTCKKIYRLFMSS
jgi:hypothetical protein